jgi:hypothetical protein
MGIDISTTSLDVANILTSASGRLLGVTLGYPDDTNQRIRRVPGELAPLYDEDSKFYLGEQAVQGPLHTLQRAGRQIALNRNDESKPIEDHDRDLLAVHGLDEKDPRAPDALIRNSCELAKFTSSDAGGVIYGIDYIQGTDGCLHFLELNQNPGRPSAFLASHQAGIPEQDRK